MYPVIDKRRTGIRLKYLMNRKGLTPKDIQKYLSLSCVQTVYRWLEGINVPAVDNLYALTELFGVKMDEMIIGNGKKDPFPFDFCNHRLSAYYLRLSRNKMAIFEF